MHPPGVGLTPTAGAWYGCRVLLGTGSYVNTAGPEEAGRHPHGRRLRSFCGVPLGGRRFWVDYCKTIGYTLTQWLNLSKPRSR